MRHIFISLPLFVLFEGLLRQLAKLVQRLAISMTHRLLPSFGIQPAPLFFVERSVTHADVYASDIKNIVVKGRQKPQLRQ